MASPEPGAERETPQIGQRGKEEIRARTRKSRATRSADTRVTDDVARTKLLLNILGSWTPRIVAAYASTGDEPGTQTLIDALVKRGSKLLLPVLSATWSGPRREADWATYEGWDRLRRGLWGIPEPDSEPLGPVAIASADLVLLPGLAGSQDGARVGMGGGWYDRALVGTTCPRWLLLNDDELYESLPRDPWDLPVSTIITPTRVVRC